MTKTELKKMTVADVLQTPEFKTNLEKLLNLLWESRQKARFKAHSNNQALKVHPIDELHDSGYWETEKFIAEYCSVIDKQSRLTTAKREYIREVGTSAYYNTIKPIQDETKRNKRIRKDK